MKFKSLILAASLMIAVVGCKPKPQEFSDAGITVTATSDWHKGSAVSETLYLMKGTDSELSVLSGSYSTLMFSYSEHEWTLDKSFLGSDATDYSLDVNGTKWSGYIYNNNQNAVLCNEVRNVQVSMYNGTSESIDYQGDELKSIIASIKINR